MAGSCVSGNETSSFFIIRDIINCQELLSYKKLVNNLNLQSKFCTSHRVTSLYVTEHSQS